MPKLCQIIAVTNGKKSRAASAITEVYHLLQKPALLEGIARVYHPRDEEGEKLPSENKIVQLRCQACIAKVKGALEDLFEAVGTQDRANTQARADVIVDEQVVAVGVPVTHLLFLEKQLVDLHTFVEKLPVLDPAEEWEWSDNANCYVTRPYETVRTKKVPKAFVKAEATEKHPAQVDVFTEDVQVGTWSTIKFSGALPQAEKLAMLVRVEQLQDAVKSAREEANSTETESWNMSQALLDFIFQE